MELKHNNIQIRNAEENDAELLCKWWNDGKVMAHAGFPNGLGTTIRDVAGQIRQKSDEMHIILFEQTPIGEMNYRNLESGICEIGIKICDENFQNKGLGKLILSIFIQGIFAQPGYQKIVLDTNLANKRAQHIYEKLGFQKTKTNIDSWVDQLGNKQSSVEYELTKEMFISYI